MTQTIAPDPIHERQSTLGLTIPRSVSIIGCGGVGSWCAMFLALAGVPELWLWDGDEISLTNLNRLPLEPAYVNFNKADAMRHMLNRLVPRCRVTAISELWTPSTSSVVPDWVIAATDSHASRVLIHSWVHPDNESPRCRYLEVSADGEYGGCTDSPALFTSDLERQAGYQSVPVWVGPCVGAAMMACHRILHSDHAPIYNYRLGFNRDLNKVELQDL